MLRIGYRPKNNIVWESARPTTVNRPLIIAESARNPKVSKGSLSISLEALASFKDTAIFNVTLASFKGTAILNLNPQKTVITDHGTRTIKGKVP